MAYTATATTTAGRNGHVRSEDGVVDFDLRLPKELGGPGGAGATNPEQLFAAGYSACFGQALIAIAGAEKIKPEGVHVTAAVTLDKNDGGFFLAVKLTAKLDGIERAQAEELVRRAHEEVCPYSKATRGNIDVAVDVA
jgi:osmotically inducible protein OsmC